MSFTKAQILDHLEGLGHGTSTDSITNINALFERAAARFLSLVHPLEVMRTSSLSSTVYDDVYNYALPSDFGSIIDLAPQADRKMWDTAFRDNAGRFDLRKALDDRVISVEGSEGAKVIRINWRGHQGKVLNSCDSVTANGTWIVAGTAANLEADTITKYSGNASLRFDIATTGDGISNIGMSAVDMTDEDEVADIFVPVYIKNAVDVAKVTSIGARFGNDITTKYWTPTAQTTQADGTAFRVGWNLIKFPWSTATETGTVTPTAIDSFRITFTITSAITDIRVDNIIFIIGRAFDIKYYSKYIFKNTSGTWVSIPSSDEDTVLVDNDLLPAFINELLKEMAKQLQGSDAAFDINSAQADLNVLYPAYKGINPSQVKKVAGRYGSKRVSRGRW